MDYQLFPSIDKVTIKDANEVKRIYIPYGKSALVTLICILTFTLIGR